jgi:cell division protein FtsZ
MKIILANPRGFCAGVNMAISSPLLEASIDGAHGVLLSIQGGSDLGLFEINEAAQLVANSAAVDANIIFGAVIDDALGDEVRVTVIAAGLDENRSGRAAGGAGASGADSVAAPFGGAASPVDGPSDGASSPGSARHASPGASGQAAGSGADARITTGSGNGVSAAGVQTPAVTAAMAGHVPLLSAPVPDNGTSENGTSENGTPKTAVLPPGPGPAQSLDASHSLPRPAHAVGSGQTFDVAGTRRRPVVFEEDDELDVPDFLK